MVRESVLIVCLPHSAVILSEINDGNLEHHAGCHGSIFPAPSVNQFEF